MKNKYPELFQAIQKYNNIILVTHYSPDGDALGSMAALAYALIALGKTVRLYNQSVQPENFSWVPLPCVLDNELNKLKDFPAELLITLDCGDESRTGRELLPLLQNKKTLPWKDIVVVNIDHHFGNSEFGDLNIVESDAPATAFIIGELIESLGLELKDEIGIGVFLGIYTDTGAFAYPSTTAKSLEMGARVIKNGLNIREFTEKLSNTWTLNRMQLWGRLWQELELCSGGKVAISKIPHAYFEDTQTTSEDLEGYASFLRHLKGVKAVLMIRERKDGTVKASFRSDGVINVQQIAFELGGGGHKAAAGVDSNLDMQTFAGKARILLEQYIR
ncbi:DHH family phosphoesterase [Desulfovibrio litoralis]|uniref:Phosphoesterase RecJ domain-containing protein n=1 Tax=Desulfovibrio litoralis DSM 11393 TaxID=1121455 RepID=A0A1M7S8R5_9BACT|nr:bifunctional oligoribonuclease/PAP phosphatase NrnA [Desulfovibrio litoralis]SHN54833.1 phosphoesterase RecJ domain-containing protein [Desulfovibrio litoralis DSM 11393]